MLQVELWCSVLSALVFITFVFNLCVWREILQEIQRLRQQHEEASHPPYDKNQQNPMLLAELRLLRYTFTHILRLRDTHTHIHWNVMSCGEQQTHSIFSIVTWALLVSYMNESSWEPIYKTHCFLFEHIKQSSRFTVIFTELGPDQLLT